MPDPTGQASRGDQPPSENELTARRLIAEGAALAKRNLWSAAEASFIQSGRLFPSSLAWLGAAITCWNQKKFADAATCVEWALHAIPIRATQESEAGIARYQANDWHGVEKSFRTLLKISPVDTPTHLFLCIALINLGRLDEAGDQLMAGWQQELADSGLPAGG